MLLGCVFPGTDLLLPIFRPSFFSEHIASCTLTYVLFNFFSLHVFFFFPQILTVLNFPSPHPLCAWALFPISSLSSFQETAFCLLHICFIGVHLQHQWSYIPSGIKNSAGLPILDFHLEALASKAHAYRQSELQQFQSIYTDCRTRTSLACASDCLSFLVIKQKSNTCQLYWDKFV